MPLPSPQKKSREGLDLPTPPELSEGEQENSDFESFMGEQREYEARFHVAMNEHAEELKELGLDQNTFKVALSSIASDLQSSLAKPTPPPHLKERFEEREQKLREPLRMRVERLADEQIRKEANQRDLEGLQDMYERGAIKGHPLEPLLNKLFEEKEKENGNEE